MPDLLALIRSDIDARLSELRAAVEEPAQPQRAADALGDDRAQASNPARPRPATKRSARGSSPAPATPRAPRGSKQQAIIDYLARHPTGTAGEIAKETSLSRTSVAATLSKLTQRGTLTRAERGYRLTEPPAVHTCPRPPYAPA